MSKTAEEWLQEANQFGNAGQNAEAVEHCDKAISVDPTYGEAYFYKAYYLPVGADAEKLVIYEKAVEVGYIYTWTYQNLGNCYMALDRLQEAINHYLKVIELDESKNFFWSLIGLLYQQMGNKDMAMEYYDLCLEKGVDVGNTCLYKGKLLAQEGKYEEALKYLEQGLAVYPAHIELLYQNGKVCKILGQEARALEHFNKAISIAPANPNDWCNRALSFIALGRKEEGLSDLRTTRSELETNDQIVYSPGYKNFMKSTITSILEAEELDEKTKVVEEELEQNSALQDSVQKYKAVLHDLQSQNDTMQNKLIDQLSHTQSNEATKNIDDFHKLKAEFEQKLLEIQAAFQQQLTQVKNDVTVLDNKVTTMENNMEIMKEEINNKLDDFSKKLNNELDKQNLSPEDKTKLNEYFKAFIGTISSIHVTSQVIDSDQVQIDARNNSTTILSTLASFAPFIGNALSTGITSLGEFLQTKEMKKNARKVKGLASDTTSLSQLLGESAYKILLDKKKQEQIIQTSDQDLRQSFGNLFQKISVFCENFSTDIDIYLYSSLYKTPAEILGHQDANYVIEKWIQGTMTPICLHQQFVECILTTTVEDVENENNSPTAVEAEIMEPQSEKNRICCCQMF